MKYITLALVVVIALIGIIDVFEPSGWGFVSKVGTGKVAVVTRFGKVQEETLDSGFHFKNFFDVLNPIDVRTQAHRMELSAFSSDIQQVSAYLTINYNIDKVNAITLFRDIGKNYEESLITPRLLENTKIVFANYTAEALVQRRDELSTRTLELMKEDLLPYGINVTAIAVEDVDFTDAFTSAVEAKQVATQQKLTAQTEQERMTMEATAAAERETIAAQADAEKAKIAADAEAYVIMTEANAEAEANQKIAESLTEALIDYNTALRWDGKLPTTMLQGDEAVPIIPVQQQ